jgi:hypothetical protein
MTKCYEKKIICAGIKRQKINIYYNISNSNSDNVQLQWKHDFEKNTLVLQQLQLFLCSNLNIQLWIAQ